MAHAQQHESSRLTDEGEGFSFLAAQLLDQETQWSLGTFGAIAEFTRDAGEPAAIMRDGGAVSVSTARGGIRIDDVPEIRLFASEGVTKAAWSQRVALCLPKALCAMSGRGVLTELGADRGALRAQDRDAVLFDLGLGALQLDACIRVAEPSVVEALRAQAGRSLFAAGNPAMKVILAANPHRVFASRLGRIEVYSAIPPPDGRSPDGPHTHLLPGLLVHRRTHPATEPTPEGFVPCAHLYPAHPLRDADGEAQCFDGLLHREFQNILRRYGDPALIELKRQVVSAIERDEDPAQFRVPSDRFARAGLRVVLRQMQAAGRVSHALARWMAVYDRVHAVESDSDAEPEIH